MHKVVAVAAVGVLFGILAGCESSTPDAVRRCNSPTATLDDPKMWDCYTFDRAANDRMLARKKAEVDARIKAGNGDKTLSVANVVAQQPTPTSCKISGMQNGFVSTSCRP